jgi:hypothetical protein
MGTLCERNTCTHFIIQPPIGIAILFIHEIFLSLSIKEEFSLNVGYSDVLYFVILPCSLKQTPLSEVCCSGSRMSRHVVWLKPPEHFEEPVLFIFSFYCNENCSSEKSLLISIRIHNITSQGTVFFTYYRSILKQTISTTPKL